MIRRHGAQASRFRTGTTFGLEAAIAAGATAAIQPGGSRPDPEVIASADKAGIAMVFTGIRQFRH